MLGVTDISDVVVFLWSIMMFRVLPICSVILRVVAVAERFLCEVYVVSAHESWSWK